VITRRILFSFFLACGVVSCPRAQSRPKLIGGLLPVDQKAAERAVAEFVQALQQLGYVPRRDFNIVFRAADGSDERLRGFAAEMVTLNVDVFVVATTNAATALKEVAGTRPIVFYSVAEPVTSGFADSLTRPGRNMTGISNEGNNLYPKRLDLLRQMIPDLARIAFLVNPESPLKSWVPQSLQSLAEDAGLRAVTVNANKSEELDQAFREMVAFRAQALMVTGDVVLLRLRKSIADLAIKNRLATIWPFGVAAADGALMGYGANGDDVARQVAIYVDKILRGSKPGDIPIEEPTGFDFVINRRTADLLRIKIPSALLIQATEVVE
jgi:putative tryptophan/tyrosine transport system substrate-binding protein